MILLLTSHSYVQHELLHTQQHFDWCQQFCRLEKKRVSLFCSCFNLSCVCACLRLVQKKLQISTASWPQICCKELLFYCCENIIIMNYWIIDIHCLFFSADGFIFLLLLLNAQCEKSKRCWKHTNSVWNELKCEEKIMSCYILSEILSFSEYSQESLYSVSWLWVIIYFYFFWGGGILVLEISLWLLSYSSDCGTVLRELAVTLLCDVLSWWFWLVFCSVCLMPACFLLARSTEL